MYIRPVRLADLPLLTRLRRQTLRLDLPASLVMRFSPLRAALASWFPLTTGTRTFVLGEPRLRAFVQVAARARGQKWEVVYLGAGIRESCEADSHPWPLLLNYAAIAASRRRVTRLLAKVPETVADLVCFRRAGYTPYARELIYTKVYSEEDRYVDAGPELRPQRASDAWMIHRLYFATAPRAVQDAEAHTSNHWELRRVRSGGLRERGWVVEEEAETVAYARALSRWHVHMVEWLFGPAQREMVPGLVRQTLAQLPAAPGDRVYCCLREYQSEVEEAVQAAGFTLSGTQALMVKYLAVKATVRERVFAPALPAAARRVPSYLRRAGGG